MPIFDFLCHACMYEFEMMRSNTTSSPVRCPRCESEDTEKLVSAFGGYHIKGYNGASQRPKQAGSFKKPKPI